MPDREKVAGDLEGLIWDDWHEWHSDSEVRQIAKDAIELLKEQESVVHPEPSYEMTYITNCCCDLCGAQLIREDNFCRCCGKRIEWEGR